MREVLSEIAATNWRDWLTTAFEFAGVVVIVAAIAVLAIGLAPDINP